MTGIDPQALLGRLRTGGCLLALLVLLLVLVVVALAYSPPQPPPPVRAPTADAAAGDAAFAERPAVRAVALAPDARIVAYGGEESHEGRQAICLRRIGEGKFADREAPWRTIAAHGGPVRALRFRPDGRELLSASDDGTVGWWNVDTGERIAELVPPLEEGRERGLLALALSPDGRWVAAGGWSGDVWVWDLADPAPAPLRFAATRQPWADDPKKLKPTGHLEEVRSLLFLAGDPPLLFSGGGEGLVGAWNLATGRAGRIATAEGKTPSVRDVLMREVQSSRDEDFAVLALLASSARQGLLAADYRGCVYLLSTAGPCGEWWRGREFPATPTCIHPLLDRKKYCVPFERRVEDVEASFMGLLEVPGLAGGFAGISWNQRFLVFRSGDAVPWRQFESSAPREWMGGFDVSPAARLVVTGGQSGRLRLYSLEGRPSAPDVRRVDEI